MRGLNEVNLSELQWRFHPGDNPGWSALQLHDNNWEKVLPVFGNTHPIKSWSGKGWFRLWIDIDSNVVNQTLALRINHQGTSEIYVDGLLKSIIGVIGNDAGSTIAKRKPYQLIPFFFSKAGRHLIAIRYANFKPAAPWFQGFELTLGDHAQLAEGIAEHQRLYGYMLMSIAVLIALGLLHLFLFLFYPRQILNLYYSIFLLILVCGGITVYLMDQTDSPLVRNNAMHIHWVSNILWVYAAWILLYSLHFPIKKSKRVIVYGIVTSFFILAVLLFVSSFVFYAYIAFSLLLMIDGLWQVYQAYKAGKPHVWLVGLGMLTVFIAYLFAGSNLLHNWSDETHRTLAMCIGILGLPFCYSLYLALDFAGTNKALASQAIAKEIEKRELIEAQAGILERTVAQKTAQVQEQADRLREMDALKSRFFINITHEFRTPLTLILGTTDQLGNQYRDAFLVQKIESIKRNSQQLLQLIDELLELGKLEAGRVKINEAYIDIVSFSRILLYSFESVAGQKQVGLGFSSNVEKQGMNIDHQKLEKIILNIIGNAVKFTDAGGMVSLDLQSKGGSHLVLTVTDNGRGIADTRLPYIFDRFYQAESSDTRFQGGVGIGLALTKELVNLLDGQISVVSREYEGTTVKVVLPLSDMESMEIEGSEVMEVPVPAAIELPPVFNPLDEQPLILVIEDHRELLHFMRESLTGNFKTIGAEDGNEGIQKAMTHIPDLIITDLMMPEADGFSVCKKLKEDHRTSHIPIIMLTARVDRESKVEGLQTGADAYISKPFQSSELLALIRSLLFNRSLVREKYSSASNWNTRSDILPSVEKEFIINLGKIIEEHMDAEQFGIDMLAVKVGLSRAQLHRKLKMLTGETPGDLIRRLRMEKAFELLRNNAGNVSQVSYMVGFGNPANFSTSFLRHFGFSPGEVGKDL
ncbi:ATP-binding protein [Niabella sp. CJ426]|uniref:ATP-binding protein n=1 Tax=Niabella sp. CJ426 TaxID=3393740 RepID=UPI003D010BF5